MSQPHLLDVVADLQDRVRALERTLALHTQRIELLLADVRQIRNGSATTKKDKR